MNQPVATLTIIERPVRESSNKERTNQLQPAASPQQPIEQSAAAAASQLNRRRTEDFFKQQATTVWLTQATMNKGTSERAGVAAPVEPETTTKATAMMRAKPLRVISTHKYHCTRRDYWRCGCWGRCGGGGNGNNSGGGSGGCCCC